MTPSHQPELRQGFHFNLHSANPEDAGKRPVADLLGKMLIYEACPGTESPAIHIRHMVRIAESSRKILVGDINGRTLVVTPRSNFEQVTTEATSLK